MEERKFFIMILYFINKLNKFLMLINNIKCKMFGNSSKSHQAFTHGFGVSFVLARKLYNFEGHLINLPGLFFFNSKIL